MFELTRSVDSLEVAIEAGHLGDGSAVIHTPRYRMTGEVEDGMLVFEEMV